MRYKVTVAYIGTAYAGFQSQINALAIQDVIENALSQIFTRPIRIVFASRTDAGVHALGQVFHFDSEKRDSYKLKGSLNALLPKDIHILKVEETDDNFHARFSVKEKTYIYLINTGERDVFLENRAFQKPYFLDYKKIEDACSLFVGKHDFTSFNSAPLSLYPNQIRTIYEFTLHKEKRRYAFVIRGDGFLSHMIRIMVGELIEVGRGHKDIAEIIDLLKNPCKDKKRYCIDACGLYLAKIIY